MNSEQPVPPISVAPTQPAVADEANPIVAALLARTRWMQRALTPWTQRWLAQAAESADSPSVAGGRRGLSIALTAGAAEQTLSRVKAISIICQPCGSGRYRCASVGGCAAPTSSRAC